MNFCRQRRDKRIRALPGMGGKTEYSIIKGIEMLEQTSDKNTLGFVLPMAEELLAYLPDVNRSNRHLWPAASAGANRWSLI